ncbi:sigma-54 dependent transcriptional regulator [Sphingomonas sp. A2-49]|uniref:sigma-54-dependent transcriptional regulator n=1 Tax=Sphingomonas sp. A2-49 TaxID=1391375 RepID=UPI0021D3B694|nr:sigma-54 dependent transcriptional regulator [Sphingomonas sp. A2-49]MCU6454746.1 sigma-54 dependent transcriptional regulator [Sphingomonas sp. A2-49]
MSGQTILFVEDDEALRGATVQAMELAGLTVRAFAGAEAALAALTPDFDGVIVSDIRMPRMDGLQLLANVRALDADLPVILVTGHGDVPMAVAALHDGAFDFLTKPFASDHLIATIARALERRGLIVENRRLRAAVAEGEAASPLIGDSAAIVALRGTIRRLAEADIDVLIEGETGTGKDLVAAMLHRLGPRRKRPFVAVHCAALAPGTAAIELFGHAADSVPHTRLARIGSIVASHGGTLLLDEIDALAPEVQAALSRVIEEREVQPIGAERSEAVNLHIVATGRGDLGEAVAAGAFRANLYHRLAAARLRLPPLRDRGHDRMLLFVAFVEEARGALARPDFRIDEAARRHVLEHGWPGNVRELRNHAFACVLDGDGDAAADREAARDLPTRVAEFETRTIVDALRASGGNVVRTVELLGVPRKTLYYKLSRYGIDPEAFRPVRTGQGPE